MSKSIRIGIVLAVLAVFAIAVFLKEGGRDRPVAAEAPPQTQEEVESRALSGPADQTASNEPNEPSAPGETPGDRVAHEDTALPRLLDLGSDKCIPCKMMAPILEDLEKEYAGRMIVEVIDVRANRAAASLYSVRVIPTQIFFDASGEELFRHEGFMDKAAILEKWTELGVDF